MIKNFRFVISFIIIFMSSVLLLGVEFDTFDIINYLKQEKVGLNVIFSKERYDYDEGICINYIPRNNDKIIYIDVDCDGFSIQKNSKNIGMITAFLDRKEKNSICSLKTDITLKDGDTMSCFIYGFCSDCGVFISKYSAGHAKQLYYEYLYNNKTVTEDDVYKLINDDIKKSIIYEENNEIFSNRSVVELNTQLVWIEDGETSADEHPLAFTKFQLIDNNSSNTFTYYTDENGYFPAGIYVDTPTNLTIKIYAAGENTNVVKWTLLVNTPWVFEDNYNESTSKITVTSESTTDYGRAQQISQALIYAEKYAQFINGAPLSSVSALYPASTTDYNSFLNMIRISGESADFDYSDWDVIMHEYGHHVTSELQLEDNPGLSHYSDENLADRYDKSRGTRLAWDEAVATIFGAMAQEYFSSSLSTINMVADGGYSDNGYLYYYYNNITTRIGEACERTIIGILWDLFDTDTVVEIHDDSSMTDSQFWNIMISSGAKTLSQYVSYYYLYFTDMYNRNKLNKILEYYKVSPENIHLSTYSNDLSYCNPTFIWTANGTSSTLQNNRFSVQIYRDDYIEYMNFSTSVPYITLTEEQWITILDWPCRQIIVVVYGFQDDSPSTGPYGTKYCYYNKPQFQITYIDDDVSIIGLNYETTFLNIPTIINGKLVTEISDGAFVGCTSLESITIPSSVESIGDDAFRFCFSLSEVIVLKDTTPLTSLGEHAFDDCDSHLEIKVPRNRVADYKAITYWSSYSNRIVPNIPIIGNVDIDCLTENDIGITLNEEESKFYKVVIDCGKSYQFVADSLDEVTMLLYNSNMSLVYSNSEYNNDNTLTGFLSPGVYYLEIEYASSEDSGSFNLEYSPTYLVTNSTLLFGTNNIQNSIHSINNNKKHGYYAYSHTLGEGFFKLSINGGYNNNYPAGAIKVYTNSNKTHTLDRYPNNNSIKAISNQNENELYIYFPNNGTYYIDILLYASNSVNPTFIISNLDSSILDYSNNLQFISFNLIFEEQDTFSYFNEVSISHKSKIQVDINSLGNINEDIPIYLYQQVLVPGNDPGDVHYNYVLLSSLAWKITSNSQSPLFNITLDAGTYYLGYSNNTNHIDVSIALRRIVDYEASSLATLVTDPALNQGYTLGSEVNFNGGATFDTTITEGFTRCIYLMFDNYIALPDSRLDYDWYSSNDNVATVTRYGTVLARPVNSNTNVMIYAVLKEDPSVVLSIQLTVLDDLETDEIEIVSNLSYSYSQENGIYQLELDNTNSPYPWINYYIWAIDIPNDYPNLEVEMNQWGYITSNGTGAAILTANYYLNPRVYLTIYLTITS